MKPQWYAYADVFLSHVELAVDGSGCWVWIGAHDDDGYTNVVVPHGFPEAGKSRRMKAHRVALILFMDVFLGKLRVHHTCETRDCVNPDHLQALTLVAHQAEHRACPIEAHDAREAMAW